MSRRLFPGRIADEIAGAERSRAERLKQLAHGLIGVVRDGLIRDGQVRIHGFGTFRLSPTRARKGINPRTGERIDIPARNRVLFRPAKALRERIEPRATSAVPLAEPHASREAALGGVMSEAPAAGAVPTSDENGQQRSYFPDRIAAAAISDTVVRTTGEPPTAASGSREANLGGTMGDSPHAGRVPLISGSAGEEPVEDAIPDTDRAAANEAYERGSREAVLGASAPASASARTAGALPPEDLPPEAQEPERPATVPATRHGPRPVGSTADEAGVDLPAGASREAGLSGEAAVPPAGGLPTGEEDSGAGHGGFEAETPLREDTAPATSVRDSGESRPSAPDEGDAGHSESQPVRRRIVIDDDVESGRVPPPEADEAREERSRLPFLLILLLLVLLIAALVWWFWPRAQAPAVTQPADGGAVEEIAPTEAPAAAAVEGDAAAEATGSSATAVMEEEGAIEASGPADTAPAAPAGEVAETPVDETDTAVVEEPMVTEPERTDTAAGGSVDAQSGQSLQEEAVAGAAETPATASVQAEEAPVMAAETAAATETGTPWFSGRDYSVQRGDTLWALSDNHYVNPYYWPHIWNHNQAIGNPDRIEIDQTLWLPALQGEPRSLTAADRRSIAEGYLRLYHLWTETGAANPQYALVGVRYFDPSVMPAELRNDPSAGRPDDTLAAAFEAQLQAAFPRR